MAIIKAGELAYCRIQLPDLDKAEEFLVDFGLLPAHREPTRRYYRPTDPTPYCYVVDQGPEQFLGFAFHASSEADLMTIASACGTSISEIDAPGGGKRTRLKEPNGFEVDIVWGITVADPVYVESQRFNTGAEPLARKGELFRRRIGVPTPVKRLAHVVLTSPQVKETISWFQDTLGLIVSDAIEVGPERNPIGVFMRIDAAERYVDHHAFFVLHHARAGLQHISFESQDLDAVLADNYYLTKLGKYQHYWGIGRHLLGSQVFDYWADPWGYAHEHWTDSDRLNSSVETQSHSPQEGFVSQWGDHAPEPFKSLTKP